MAPAVQVTNNSHWIFSTAKQLSHETYGLIKNTYFFATEDVIKEFFKQGQWAIVSDGSYNPNYRKGTAAVIIESTTGVQLIKSYVLTPGVDSDINAYRSELIGIMVGCLILKMYSDRYEIVDKKVQFGCDNEKAVQLGLCSKIFSPVMTKHVDIIWEIQSLCRTTKMILEAKHVKGHQSIFQCERSQLARMNSEADALAKRHLRFCIDNPEINISQHLGGSHWSVWCGDRKIVKDIDAEMTRYIHGSKLKAHITQRKGWSKETLECVDWDTMSSVCKSDTCSDTIWKMKIASGFVPVATRMVLNKQWDSDVCPRCGSSIENMEHLLACPMPEAAKLRKKQMNKMCTMLLERNTDPCIISTIVNTLESKVSGRFQYHVPPAASRWVRQAAQEQDQLGRISIFQGYVSKTLSLAQNEYWASLPTSKRRSIRQWSCLFMRLWLQFLRDQWEHRNDHLHNKSKEDQKRKKEAEINKKIIYQHSLGMSDLRKSDEYLIADKNKEELMVMDIKRKAQWVDQIESARKKIRIIETAEMPAMRRFMKNWQTQSN